MQNGTRMNTEQFIYVSNPDLFIEGETFRAINNSIWIETYKFDEHKKEWTRDASISLYPEIVYKILEKIMIHEKIHESDQHVSYREPRPAMIKIILINDYEPCRKSIEVVSSDFERSLSTKVYPKQKLF